MSTVPPTDPASVSSPRRRDRSTAPLGMGLVPGSGELLAWILALVVAMLVTWIADTLGTADWMNFFLWTTVAYLLSRGIAKATRVYEM